MTILVIVSVVATLSPRILPIHIQIGGKRLTAAQLTEKFLKTKRGKKLIKKNKRKGIPVTKTKKLMVKAINKIRRKKKNTEPVTAPLRDGSFYMTYDTDTDTDDTDTDTDTDTDADDTDTDTVRVSVIASDRHSSSDMTYSTSDTDTDTDADFSIKYHF
uniref:Uncharacterized protein n=1 Tax=viral metagenome TaxID=1070528 RepID=A0A6C0J5N4_9ZZZZ